MSAGAVMWAAPADAAPPSARKSGEGRKLKEQGEHDQGGRESSGPVTHETPPVVSY